MDYVWLRKGEDQDFPVLIAQDDVIHCMEAWMMSFMDNLMIVARRMCHWINWIRYNKIVLEYDKQFVLIDFQLDTKEVRFNVLEDMIKYMKSSRGFEDDMENLEMAMENFPDLES